LLRFIYTGKLLEYTHDNPPTFPLHPPGTIKMPSLFSVFSSLLSLSSCLLGRLASLDYQRRHKMPALTPARQWYAVSLVSSLFFLWGFAYGLLDTMNFHVREIMGLQRKHAALLATGYYAAYLLCPLPMSGPLIKRWGYRCAFIAGLLFFMFGNFAMGGAAKGESFPGMVAAMFVVGMGVSTLERAANPYAAKVGPPGTAELRLVFAQGAAAIGTIVAPLVAAQAVPDGADNKAKMASVITLYNGVGYGVLGLIVLFLWIFFGTSIVPEIEEQKHAADESEGQLASRSSISRFFSHPIWSYRRLWCAWFANFINISNQVIVAQFFIEYARTVRPGKTSSVQAQNFLSVAQTFFAVGRYVFVVMIIWIKPRISMVLFVVLAVGTVGIATSVTGFPGILMLMLAMFGEGPTFPTTFATGIRDLSHHSSLGESILIMSICGGAVGPPVFGIIADSFGVRVAFWLPAVGFFFPVLFYVVGLNSLWKKDFDRDWYEEKKQKAERKALKASTKAQKVATESAPESNVEMQPTNGSGTSQGADQSEPV
jgi:MFS transporter, FHS family, L-fucose permease